jgi:hypothetical protein
LRLFVPYTFWNRGGTRSVGFCSLMRARRVRRAWRAWCARRAAPDDQVVQWEFKIKKECHAYLFSMSGSIPSNTKANQIHIPSNWSIPKRMRNEV